VTLPLIPLQVIAVACNLRLARRLPRFYHRIMTRIMGFDVVVTGTPVETAPVLFVGNHVSYLDIVVLASVIETSFIAKAEIARWPLFGWLARLQRSVFVERRSARAGAQRDEIAERLAAGDNLVLFPEGTSDDGIHVLPFRSALFGVAEREVAGRPLTVQPFSIAYTRLHGVPIGREWQPLYAWYGDMDMQSHLWRVLGLGRARIDLVFHPPVTITAFGSRKALADHCFTAVRDGVLRALSGALPPPAAGPSA
jgi:1-acyl-sn-glycerol-3-phosphate acyltransferase